MGDALLDAVEEAVALEREALRAAQAASRAGLSVCVPRASHVCLAGAVAGAVAG